MNLYLLSPEIALGLLAVLVILLDLLIERKVWLAAISTIGLVIPAFFVLTIVLGGDQGSSFNDMLVVDDFSLYFKILFLGIAALVILASVDYAARFPRFQGEYYALVLLTVGGMMLMASTGELISLYISLELTGLGLYALAGFLKDPKSSEAGLKFLLLGAVSSAILLYGMALVFGLTGTTDLHLIAKAVATATGANQLVLLLAIIFMVAGFGFKIAAVPFQMWVPDVYEGAPTPVTAYLSVASKAAGFAVILRVFNVAFGDIVGRLDWPLLFAVLSVATMTLGNVVAIAQPNIKRMLGYSSIAQAGYLMIGLATISSLGRSGVLFFLISYAFTNLGAFIAIIAISNRINSDLIDDYSGMSRRAPALALALTFCLLSLTGIPPTAGFIAKIYIFNAAVQQNLVWLVIIGVINTVISAYYYLRVVKVMYLSAAPSEEGIPLSKPLLTALSIAVIGVLLVGVYPTPLLDLALLAGSTIVP